MRFHRTFALSTGLLLTATGFASAQVTTLVLEGDNIPGAGNVTVIDNIAISPTGDWLAEVRTDNPNTAINKVVLKNGAIYQQKGQSMSAPAGATLTGFDSLVINSNGNTAHNLTLGNVGPNDEGIYWNDKLIVRSGDTVTATGFTAGTTFMTFHEVRLNDNEQVAAIVSVNDSLIPGPDDLAIFVWDTDGSGNVTAENVLVKEGDFYGTGGQAVNGMDLNAHIWSFNDSGSFMAKFILNTGSGGTDEIIMYDQTIIAEESFPSPIAGRNWSTMSTPEMGLNDNGDWVVSAGLDGGTGDDQIIIKNNAKFVQEGDFLPDMNGFSLKAFGSGPVEVANSGDVLWFCFTTESDNTKDTGIWLNQSLLIQEGVTPVGGNIVKSLAGVIDGYHIDQSGQYVIFEATLDNNLDGVFRVAVSTGQPGTPMCFGDGTGSICPCGNNGLAGQGCTNSSGSGGILTATGSASVAQNSLNFSSTSIAAGRTTLLVSNTSQNTGVFGDGIMCLGSAPTAHSVVISSPSGVSNWSSSQMTNTNFTPGQDRYFQVLFRDPAGPCGSAFNSTSAYKISFTP